MTDLVKPSQGYLQPSPNIGKQAKFPENLSKFPEDNHCPNPLVWWHNRRHEYPVPYEMALDLFSIPGMSSECGRVFSQTKKFVADERNRLSPKTIGAVQL